MQPSAMTGARDGMAGPKGLRPGHTPPKEPNVLTADDAADIAARHGLKIGDAAALRTLADDPDTAERIAAKFAPPPDPDALGAAVWERTRTTGGAR
jgi:hypothetical protein